MNILIYPAGTEIGLEVARALSHQKGIKIFAANSVEDYSYIVHDRLHPVASIYDDFAIEQLRRLVEKLNIDFIYPCHDEAIYRLSKTDLPTICPPEWTAEICRFKSKTYQIFSEFSPKIYCNSLKKRDIEFPVFCKPDAGQGSRGTWKANSFPELVQKWDGELILEYLPGKEYTIDCFTSGDGRLFMFQRERTDVKNGISTGSVRVFKREISEMGHTINTVLDLRGAWFFQVKEKLGKPYLMEIAPRPAGCSCFTRASGFNLPLLTIYDRQGIKVETMPTPGIESVVRSLRNGYKFSHYYEEVNVDLDDTLCPEMIGLLLKLKERGNKINLVTRNKTPLAVLSSFHVNETLFDNITIVSGKKSDIVKRGIFIDDSFSERKDVFEKHKIPCFDVQQAIEVL